LEERMRGRNPIFLTHMVIFVFVLGALTFGQENMTPDEMELFKKYQSLDKNFVKGKMFFAREDYKKASKEFEQILEKLPEHADAHFFLSQIFYREGNLENAMDHVRKAKEYYKFSAKMKVKMAQVGKINLEEKKLEFENTLRELEEKIVSLPDKSEHAEEEGKMKTSLQDKIDDIKKQLENINTQLNMPLPSEEEIPADYFYLHGNIYFRMKKFQEAHDEYQEAIKTDPTHGDAYNNLAALYFQVRQYEKALSYLDQAEENGAEVNPELKKAVLKALGKN
jgi:pentatricopeptide repeat protein